MLIPPTPYFAPAGTVRSWSAYVGISWGGGVSVITVQTPRGEFIGGAGLC